MKIYGGTTPEEIADMALLGLANEKHKFGIELGYMPKARVDAFERGIDNEWFTLVDLSAGVGAAPGRVLRVFRLTEAGRARLLLLKAKKVQK